MASVMALLSKSFFEKQLNTPGVPAVGDVVVLDRYLSKVKRLQALEANDALFLVTVRPPKEALWLVAILEGPTFEGTHWQAGSPNRTAITDVTNCISKLRFDSGKGITAAPGRLGMSLQTPRILTDDDVSVLRQAGGASKPAAKPAAKASAKSAAATDGAALAKQLKSDPGNARLRNQAAQAFAAQGDHEQSDKLLAGHFINFNAHDAGRLPCLCKRCIASAPARATTKGVEFVRQFVVAEGRVLHYWLPETQLGQRQRVAGSVESNLRNRLRVDS